MQPVAFQLCVNTETHFLRHLIRSPSVTSALHLQSHDVVTCQDDTHRGKPDPPDLSFAFLQRGKQDVQVILLFTAEAQGRGNREVSEMTWCHRTRCCRRKTWTCRSNSWGRVGRTPRQRCPHCSGSPRRSRLYPPHSPPSQTSRPFHLWEEKEHSHVPGHKTRP